MSETTNTGGAGEVETLRARLAEVERESEGRRAALLSKGQEARAEWLRAEKAEADLAAEREARQRAEECNEAMREPMRRLREVADIWAHGEGVVVDAILGRLAAAEAQVAALAAALLTERGEHHDRLCAWVLSEGACDCHYGRIDAALTDARPALDAAIEEATRPLREQVAGLAAFARSLADNTCRCEVRREGCCIETAVRDARAALTDAAPILAAHVERETAALREERDRLAAALREVEFYPAPDAYEGARSCHSCAAFAPKHFSHCPIGSALAGSDEALRAVKAQVRREALEEAVSVVARVKPRRGDYLAADFAVVDAVGAVRFLLDAPAKEAKPYTCDSRGVEASGCNDPYGRCTLCPRSREADRGED